MEKYKKSLIITLALQALFLILWFLPMVSYSVADSGRYGGTNSFADCFEGASNVLIFFVMFHIAAMICVGVPLVRRDLDKRRCFIAPKISIFLELGMWLLSMSSVMDWEKQYADYDAKCSFTFGGWLFLIVMAALVIMLFLLSYQSKTICEQKEKATFVADAYARKDSGAEPVPAGGWRCSCGRAHTAYVSSCPCGASKSDAQQRVE